MPRVEVALTITVRGALAAGSGARDARGRLMLPASQVKGRLRHACEQVARAAGLAVCRPPTAATMCPHAPAVAAPPCAVCALFGAPAWPSPLRWRDLPVAADSTGGRADTLPSAMRAGVALDRRLGVALPGSAYLIETSPPLPAEGVRFAADSAIAGALGEPALLHLLLAGCLLVTGIGAGESRGLGWSAVTAAARLDGTLVDFEPGALSQLGTTAASRAESEGRDGR